MSLEEFCHGTPAPSDHVVGSDCAISASSSRSHAIDMRPLDRNPFVRVRLVILLMLRLVLTPALKLPVFRHNIEMAISNYFTSFNGAFVKQRPKAIPHRACKTKAWKHLTVRLGVEPDFVNQFVFHGNILLHEPSSRKRGHGGYGPESNLPPSQRVE